MSGFGRGGGENAVTVTRDGVGGDLFSGCVEVLWELIQSMTSRNRRGNELIPLHDGPEHDIRHHGETDASIRRLERLRERFGKLYFWGQGFLDHDGGLDRILSISSPLKWRVLSLLVHISRVALALDSLDNCFRQDGNTTSNRSKAGRDLESVHARCVSLLINHAETSGFSEVTVLEQDPETWLELEEEFEIYVQCLVDLRPCLEHSAPDPQFPEPHVPPHQFSSNVEPLVQLWCRRIFDMFPEVDITLAERLGILNWDRFEKLRRWAIEPRTEDDLQDTQGHLTSTVTSTGVGHTLSTGNDNTTDTGLTEPEVTESGSEFRLAKGTRQYEDLETVFTASTRLAALFRVPDIPPLRHNGSRICTICQKRVDMAVKTRTAWKRHVYQDLAPYTCTIVSCPASGSDIFSNRRVWVEHEFQQHLAQRVWSCGSCSARLSTKEAFLRHIERHHPEYTILESQIAAKTSESMGLRMKPIVICPLCKMKLDPQLHVYAKHVGRHLEQIALIALRIHNYDEALEDDDEFLASKSSDSGADEDITAELYWGQASVENKTDETLQTTPSQPSALEPPAAISSTRNFEHTSPGTRSRIHKQRKIALLGSRSVGKSSLVIRFVENIFVETYYPTIENTFAKEMRVGNSTYDVEIVDTAGQDEYSISNSKHFIGTHGYILVYSVKSLASFEMIQIIYDKICHHLGTNLVPVVLVGHHSEALPEEREVTWEHGHQLSLKLNCGWTEANSKYGENVDKAFELVILEIERRHGTADPPNNSKCVVM